MAANRAKQVRVIQSQVQRPGPAARNSANGAGSGGRQGAVAAIDGWDEPLGKDLFKVIFGGLL